MVFASAGTEMSGVVADVDACESDGRKEKCEGEVRGVCFWFVVLV